MASHPESWESLPEKLPQPWRRSTSHRCRQVRGRETGERPLWRWCSRKVNTTTLPTTGPSPSPVSPAGYWSISLWAPSCNTSSQMASCPPPAVQFSKAQIMWDSAAQIYQSSLSSNGENYHNRGHHNGLLQSFRLSQPQPLGAQAWLLWHPRKYKHLDYQLPESVSEWKQAVVVDGARSDYINVRSGVPQGSVLRPWHTSMTCQTESRPLPDFCGWHHLVSLHQLSSRSCSSTRRPPQAGAVEKRTGDVLPPGQMPLTASHQVQED